MSTRVAIAGKRENPRIRNQIVIMETRYSLIFLSERRFAPVLVLLILSQKFTSSLSSAPSGNCAISTSSMPTGRQLSSLVSVSQHTSSSSYRTRVDVPHSATCRCDVHSGWILVCCGQPYN